MKKPKTTLFLISINQFLTWGILYYSFSVLIIPFKTKLGWSEATISGGFSSALFLCGIISIPIGYLLDKIGPKPIIRIGTLLAPLLLALLPLVTEIWQYYTIWLSIGFVMSLILYEPALKLVSQLPLRHDKSFAFLTMIAGVSGVVFAPFGEWMVRMYGYQFVIWFYAIIMLFIVAPSNFVATHSEHAKLTTIAKKPQYGWIFKAKVLRFLTAIFLNTFATATILVLGVLWMIKSGKTPQFGAYVLGLVGFMSLPARLFVTKIHKFSSGYHAFALLVGLQSLSIIISFFYQFDAMIILFATVFGFSLGAITPLRAVLAKQEFGHLGLGSVNGIIAFVTTMARSIGPIIGAFVLQQSLNPRFFSVLLLSSSILSLAFMTSMTRGKESKALDPILEVKN